MTFYDLAVSTSRQNHLLRKLLCRYVLTLHQLKFASVAAKSVKAKCRAAFTVVESLVVSLEHVTVEVHIELRT